MHDPDVGGGPRPSTPASVDASRDVAERMVALLEGALRFDDADRSFSTCFANVGLGFVLPEGRHDPAAGAGGPEAGASRTARGREIAGIATAYLHHNRVTRALGAPFLELRVDDRVAAVAAARYGALDVRQRLAHGEARVAFTDVDTVVLDATGVTGADLGVLRDPGLLDLRRAASHEGERRFLARVPTLDPRDPDPTTPVVLGLRLVRGRWGHDPSTLVADTDGRLTLAVALQVCDLDDALLGARLDRAAQGVEAAHERSLAWLADALGPWRPAASSAAEAVLEARAAYGLLANTCAAPGLMRDRLASFPSRGGYPVHFLWDTCFHTLGLGPMAPRLASDALEILTDTLRCDGKMAHFVTSTWLRPGASQPPLVGWALARLVDERGDLALARRTLRALHVNTGWWLANRGTRFGLIACGDPFETGWDDTPRLDDGPILALDMNAYLLAQARATARMAEAVGEHAVAMENHDRARALDAALLATAYDDVRGVFLDAAADSGERRPLLTPAAFLPLWAGVSLPLSRQRTIVRDTLLDPRRFFGDVPFPSVAYDEPSFDAGRWWRGPTWPPIAVLMLELLDRLGFGDAAASAETRLLAVLLRDGELHELFDARTGAGLGQREQGWTAALYLWLLRRRARRTQRATRGTA